jgi:hypothetical protein
MMMIGICASRLHFPKPPHAMTTPERLALCSGGPPKRGNASEGGSRAHETFSHRFRVVKCPVGRSLSRASSHLGDASLCGFCLAWLSCRFWPPALSNRDNPQRYKFPGIPFGGGSFRTPPSPASRQWPAAFSAAVYFNHEATHRTFRSGLSYDRQISNRRPIMSKRLQPPRLGSPK